jgi:Flp pilus assembly protein TadG
MNAMSICPLARNTALKLSGRLHQERGQSIVEFALVLPVLILIILGIIYFGRYENYASQETQLAESGVRWASIGWVPANYTLPASCAAPNNTLQCYVRSQAQPELQNGSSDVTQAQVWVYQPLTTNNYQSGQPLRVCVVSTVTFPSPIGSPALKLAESATMRIEQVPAGVKTTDAPWATGNPTGTMPSQCPTS